MDDKIVKSLMADYEREYSRRTNWDIHYRELAEFYLPYHDTFLSTNQVKGQTKRNHLFESTPELLLYQFSSILQSVLTPAGNKWHKLSLDRETSHSEEQWLEKLNNKLFKMRYDPITFFNNQFNQSIISIGCFGTSVMFLDYDMSNKHFIYRNISLKEICISENEFGAVDTVYRLLCLTTSQAYSKFGDNLPDSILSKVKSGEGLDDKEDTHDFIHIVKPRKVQSENKGKMSSLNKPFLSVYIHKQSSKLVNESGYDTMPYLVGRWVVGPNEVYGRSPAMIGLNDVRMINAMSETIVPSLHLAVRPPLLVANEMSYGGSITPDINPEGLTIGGLDERGTPLVKALNTGANPQLGEAGIQRKLETIKDIFLINLFQILTDTPRMTATEALIRLQEKAMLITPHISRQQGEFLLPMVHREIQLLSSNSQLPDDKPSDIKIKDIVINFDSPLTRLEASEEVLGLDRTIQQLTPLYQLDQTVFDAFDFEKMVKFLAKSNGVPASLMKSVEAMQETRDQRAEASRQQGEMAQVEAASKTGLNLSQIQKNIGQV